MIGTTVCALFNKTALPIEDMHIFSLCTAGATAATAVEGAVNLK